jgi:hypothetical protein
MPTSLLEASGELKMKSNEITEGIWDDMKSGYTDGKEGYIKRQAEKMGMSAAPVKPENPIKVQHDHIDQMFKSGRLSKAAYDIAKTKLPPLPTVATEPAKSTSAPSPDFEKKDWTKNTFRDPATKLAPGIHRVPKARTSTSTAAPAPATAVPAAPTAAPAPATVEPTTAPTTLPTKAKSKINPKDIDIDAVLKMADTLSPEEKKKMLQDLLKSNVKVRAGGA